MPGFCAYAIRGGCPFLLENAFVPRILISYPPLLSGRNSWVKFSSKFLIGFSRGGRKFEIDCENLKISKFDLEQVRPKALLHYHHVCRRS